LSDYENDILSKINLGDKKIKVVVDGGNGMGGVTAVPLYEKLGVELVELFTEPDSNFPNHHPDPTVTENLQDCIEAVKETGADLGNRV
jgi:phosphomannomutase/phosphoglucomutase